MKESLKGCDLLVRDGDAAVGCSSMRTGSMGGENHCGNLRRQSCRTIYSLVASCYTIFCAIVQVHVRSLHYCGGEVDRARMVCRRVYQQSRHHMLYEQKARLRRCIGGMNVCVTYK